MQLVTFQDEVVKLAVMSTDVTYHQAVCWVGTTDFDTVQPTVINIVSEWLVSVIPDILVVQPVSSHASPVTWPCSQRFPIKLNHCIVSQSTILSYNPPRVLSKGGKGRSRVIVKSR